MYPVFRRLDVLFAMQDYSTASLCALYHVALKKEAVRQVIIRQDDALIVVPVKVLVQKLPSLCRRIGFSTTALRFFRL